MLHVSQSKAPALFVGHGNPMNAIADNLFIASLNNLSKTLQKPKELYMVTYKAKNADFLIPQLQKIVPDLRVEKRALDHGVWSVLVHLFPDADIPVLQLSINTKFSMKEHFEMGKALEVLREEGVMIVGSGNVTHNLREAVLGEKDAPVDAWAKEFDGFVKDALLTRDFDALIDFEISQRYAHLAHPTKEHFIPLLYIAGASKNDEKSRFVYEGIEHGNLSMRSWITGE